MTSEHLDDKLSIRPGMGVMNLFRAIDYETWYALGEFVDNSVASYRQNKDALRRANPDYQFTVSIDVDHPGRRLVVRDNAAGISTEDFARALVAGEPPEDLDDLNRFGMGMKAASCWFCDKWTLSTTALGEAFSRKVVFDVKHITADKTEEVSVERQAAPAAESYTVLTLEETTKSLKGAGLSKVKKHLAAIYRRLIDSGELVLKVNGEPLAYTPPKPLVAPIAGSAEGAEEITWLRDLSFDFEGKPVTGTVLVRAVGSTKENGISMFWRNRLIKGSADTPFRPPEIYSSGNSFETQRLSIELNLDDFEVNNTKVNFIWQSGEGHFLEVLKAEIDSAPSYLAQARKYRAKEAERGKDKREITSGAVKRVIKSVEGIGPVVEDLEGEKRDPRPPTPVAQIQIDFSEERTIQVHGKPWKIRIETDHGGGHENRWYEVISEGTQGTERAILLRVFQSSPFALAFGQLSVDQFEPQLRLAMGMAIAETIAIDYGFQKAGTVREILNDLLAKQLAEIE